MRATIQRAGWTLGLLALAAGPVWPRGGELAERRDEAVAELVDDLEGVAHWANRKRIFASRDEVYRTILELDPEHREARTTLGHKREKDGWLVPDGAGTDARDFDKSAAAELPERRAEAAARFRERVVELIEEFGLDPAESEGADLLRLVLVAYPDDEVTRGLQGEVQSDGQWVLEETARAKARRAELGEIGRSAAAAAAQALRPDSPTPEESALGIAWTSAAATDRGRAVGTGDPEEVRTAAQASYAVGDFFRGVFGTETEYWGSVNMYLLANPGEKETFLQAHPGITPEQRELLMQVVGGGIGDTPDLAQWDPDRARRLDSATRHVLMGYLTVEFGILPEHGWIWEGFGLFLTRQLVGTRLTWYVQADTDASPEVLALRARLMGSDTNWMNEALELLSSDDAPRLSDVLARDLNRMGAEDMVIAYAFAAYLLEGRPDEAAGILGRVGGGTPSAQAVAEETGMDEAELQERFVRWLTERR